MKKIILFLLLPFYVFSQIATAEYYLDSDQSIFYFDEDWKKASKSEAEFYRIVKLNSDGVPIGEIRDYFKSGKIQAIIEGALLLDNNDDSNSIWEGKNTTYYESGAISYERFYVKGLLEGNVKSYYESGSLRVNWDSVNGNEEGLVKYYYENSGKIEKVEKWDDGVQLDHTSYYENGNINIKYNYVNGKVNGKWLSFYENGEPKQEANFIDGERVGLLRNFNQDGRLSFIMKFDDKGKKVFEESFYEDGKLSTSINWNGDKRDGISKDYWRNGNLRFEKNFKNGLNSGKFIYYNKQGIIISQERWENDEIVYWKKFDKFGNVIFEEIGSSTNRFPNGEGVWAIQLNKDFEDISDDSVEDKEVMYTEFRIFSAEAGYGNPYYLVIMFVEDGLSQTVRSEGFVDENNFWQGKVKWYNQNGSISEIANYIDDNRDGIQYYYDEEGGFIESLSYKNGIKDLWEYTCDDYNQNCEYIYTSDFSSLDDAKAKGWLFFDDDDETSFVATTPEDAKEKFYWELKKEIGLERTVSLPIGDEDDFQFSTSVDWWNGIDNQYFGIVVGFKDWENYTALKITSNGFYRVDVIKKGLKLGMEEGKYVEDGGYDEKTILNIIRLNGELIFSIDGKIVYNSEYGSLPGNRLGFYLSGKQAVVFDNVKVVVTASDGSYLPNNPPSNGNVGDWEGNGSGIILSTDGYIATNYHVIEDTNNIEVDFLYNNEIRSFNAKVIQTDITNDLAIIKIDDSSFRGLSSIPYNFKTRSADVGEEVFALGYPMALTGMGREIKFTDGKISSMSGFDGDITTYQSTTPIQGGNSGGPLFDSKGNLIAINSAKLKSDIADNVSYSIKSSYLLSLIDALPQNIKIPNSTILYSQPLPQKIKTLSKYVVLIKVK